ncbi:organic cation transporter protein [Neocloeon triangulifer]|uniref:organic cation transporter protein n=1 Tax=Neocloeon triangulifer TaxID=2078957 RepID=UPI00286EF436|nr:organic cation transporter protein [Neocloeon triangulifer]XP_059481457.1 organic cation transporter protein [Neocloeon triangulifer]
MVELDAVLSELGDFGRYQAFTYLLICLPVFFSAANSLTYVFTAGVPPYRCFVPDCDAGENSEFSQPWLSMAIPPLTSEGPYQPAQCSRFVRNGSGCVSGAFDTNQVENCDKWVFYPGEKTIVNEWGITCLDNQWKLSLVGTLHFAGILIGSLLCGYLADRFGRKLVLVGSLVLMSVTGVLQAVAPSYLVFQFFVLLNAVGTSGVYPLAFILGVELVGPSKREMSSMVINYFYAVGEASVGLFAWLFDDWQSLQLIVSVPPIFFIAYYWAVPESVRWLLTQKKNVKAKKIVQKVARANGVHLSQEILSTFDEGSDSDSEEQKIHTQGILQSARALLRSKRLVLRSLYLFFIWAANAFVFYGLSVNSTSLGGDKYLNFSMVCLAEIPGYSLAWLCLHKGRRPSLCGSMLLCAVTCLAAAFIPQDSHTGILILFLIGKVGITASFGIIYVYTAELYPTTMRSASVGACSMMARFGAMVAPFAPLLSIYSAPLPLLLFGSVSFVASLLSLLLPETVGTVLPDSVNQAEALCDKDQA